MMVRKDGRVTQEKGSYEYGDGVTWFRGSLIGKGGFGYVYLATLKNPRSKYSYFPSLMAVKSAEVSVSGSIQKEREVLSNVKGCPNIIRCFGEETTMGSKGVMAYNLLLEYGSGGTLADRIKKSGGNGLPELEARIYARCILRGLKHFHDIGYVHCDVKPDNIMLFPSGRRGTITEFSAKIGDFGLARRAKQNKKRKLEPYWRGTPMYLSPEAVLDNVQEEPCDIWALGCIVLEMLTGRPPWYGEKELKSEEILNKIRAGNELPKVPNEISKDAKDFLKSCFVRKSMFRLTAEMLLHQSFVEDLEEGEAIEEFENVEDLSEIESMLLVSERDNDLFDEWGYTSEGDSWREEDAAGFPEDDELVSDFAESEFEVDEIKCVTSSNIGCNKSSKTLPEVSSKDRTQYPVKFSISTGV